MKSIFASLLISTCSLLAGVEGFTNSVIVSDHPMTNAVVKVENPGTNGIVVLFFDSATKKNFLKTTNAAPAFGAIGADISVSNLVTMRPIGFVGSFRLKPGQQVVYPINRIFRKGIVVRSNGRFDASLK